MTTAINNSETMINQDSYKVINYTTEDGGVIEASFFNGSKDLVVVFAHGAVFNKESWYFLAEKLQKEGVPSLSIDFRGYGNSKGGSTAEKAFDVLGAIEFLKDKGYKRIAIVGGSMGGGAVLNALTKRSDSVIEKVALLAPAWGEAIKSKSIEKLYVVSKEEGLYSKVNQMYEDSSQPKNLKVFPGAAHAQHMFKTEYADELTSLLINFLDE